MTKPKHWNTDLATVQADETLYTDYKTEAKEEICSVKLRTTQTNSWIQLHKVKYNTTYSTNENISVKWETKPNSLEILKLVSKNKPKLTISFFGCDGTILVQGEWLCKWADQTYPQIRMELDNANSDSMDVTTMEVTQPPQDMHDSNLQCVPHTQYTQDPEATQGGPTSVTETSSTWEDHVQNVDDDVIMSERPLTSHTGVSPSEQIATCEEQLDVMVDDDITLIKQRIAQTVAGKHQSDENEDVNLADTSQAGQAEHTLADIDQEGHTLPPTTPTRIISKIETVLSSPHIHGMSRNVAIKSQFACLEDRYIQMCDNQLTMTQNMGKQIDSLTVELGTAQKQLKSHSLLIDSIKTQVESMEVNHQGERAHWQTTLEKKQGTMDSMSRDMIQTEQNWTEQVQEIQDDLTTEKEAHSALISQASPQTTNNEHNAHHQRPAHQTRYYLVQGREDPLSNFYQCQLNITTQGKSYDYSSVEQAFQHQKALTLNEPHMANSILAESDPGRVKHHASSMKSHKDIAIWENRELDTMTGLLQDKFRMSKAFHDKLISTRQAVLLHSVPNPYWGIGIATTDICHPFDPKAIKGHNIFGELLMKLRTDMAKQPEASIQPPNDQPPPTKIPICPHKTMMLPCRK